MATTEEKRDSDLTGFDFDTDEDFFGIKATEVAKTKKSTNASDVTTTIKNGKIDGDISDFEDDDSSGKTKLDGKTDKKVEPAPLERPKAKTKEKEEPKVKIKAKTDEDIEDEEVADEFKDFTDEVESS